MRSNHLSYKPKCLVSVFSNRGGDKRDRTADPLLAKQVLSQLSYTPISLGEFPFLRAFKIKQRQVKLDLTFGLGLLSFKYPFLHRKEVIQPHLPIRLPCYDFTPVVNPTFGSVLLAVRLLTSGVTDSHGVTGGVYKTRERIHRGMLIHDY